MKTTSLNTKNYILVVWGIVLLALSGFAQTAPEIPPGLLAQFNQMSPAQQRALANQYGVDITDLVAKKTFADKPAQMLAEPAVPIRPVDAAMAPKKAAPIQAPAIVKPVATIAIDPPLERFGSQIFDANVATFAPVDNIPVPPGYLLGVGDNIAIMLYGNLQLQSELVVDREGAINFPQLGPIALAGLPWIEARKVIETRVKQQLIGTNVVASLGRLRSINIFMAGEVKVPGNYSVSALTTITQAVYTAGGISPVGSYRDIQVKRRGETVATFDLYDLLLKGSLEKDIRLQTGDVVFVPPTGPMISIQGQVLRPAKFEVKQAESLGDALKMAGGLLSRSYSSQAVMQRYVPGDELPILKNVDLTDSEVLRVSLLDGDVLTVAKMAARVENPIRIKGAVERPGVFAWQPGIRVSDFLRGVDGYLKESVDLDIALIVRRKNQRMDIEVLAFDLGEAISEPGGGSDLVLQAHDELLVFSLTELGGLRAELLNPVIARLNRQADEREWPQVVQLGGAVARAGNFPLLTDQRLSDLLTLAGGENYLDIEIDREIALIIRRQPNLIDIHVRAVDLGAALLDPSGSADPLLQPLDEVILFKRTGSRLGLIGSTVARLQRQADQDEWPRTVKVLGSLDGTGTYPLTEGQRVSSLLTLLGGDDYLNIQVDLDVALIVRKDDSLVDIKVIPFTLGDALENPGSDMDPILEPLDEVLILDLVTGDGSNRMGLLDSVNKRLRNEATADKEAEVITIQGRVRLPGDYPILATGDLNYLIDLAGGFAEGAYVDQAEVSRKFITLDKQEEIELLAVDLASTSSMRSFQLKPRDIVRVNTIPGWQQEQNVTLSGEIIFPGIYAIENGETLGSVLRRAGGLTDQAFPEGAVFINQVAKEQQLIQAKTIVQRLESELATDAAIEEEGEGEGDADTAGLKKSVLAAIDGRIVISIKKILKGNKKADIELQEGDSLHVPRMNRTVSVAGEVFHPGTYVLDEGSSKSDFIALAGQETRYADKKRTYVIKADGSVTPSRGGGMWLSGFSRKSSIEAGDIIVVPTNLDYEQPLTRINAVTSIVFQSMASIAAFFNVSN